MRSSRGLAAVVRTGVVALALASAAAASPAHAADATGTIVVRIAFYPPTPVTTTTPTTRGTDTTGTAPELPPFVVSTGFPPSVMLIHRNGRPYPWRSPTFPNALAGPGPVHVLRLRVPPGRYAIALATQWRVVDITAGATRTVSFCYFGCRG